MKFSLLALIGAFLCATVVTGAPSTPNFEELELVNLFDEVDDILDKWFNFKCVRAILDKQTSPEVKALWAQYREKIESYADEEWAKCEELSDIDEQNNCKMVVMRNSMNILSEFFKEMTLMTGLDKLKIILDEIATKCYGAGSFADDLVDFEELQYDVLSNNLLGKFKCISDAISEGLKGTDFAKPWKTLKEDLEKLSGRVQACKKQPTPVEIAKCVAREAQAAKSIINGFLSNLKKVNKEAFDRIQKIIKEKCM